LTDITYNGSNVLIMCMVGVWWHILDLWCVRPTQCTRTHTHTHIWTIICNISQI